VRHYPACYDTELITNVKSFIVQTPVGSPWEVGILQSDGFKATEENLKGSKT
jgi:hypothetical protein